MAPLSMGKGENEVKLTPNDAPVQPVHAGLKPFAGELSTRWKRKKAQAKAAGFKSAWEMRKASHRAKHVGYVPTASAEPATPLLDRLEAGNGPVRIIVKDGVRL